MIVDKLSNAHKYYDVHPYFEEAFKALSEAKDEDKNIDIDGQKAHIGISDYVNKNVSECKFECHRKYIDIQFVLKGHEFIDIADENGLKFTEDYKDGGDIAFYEAPETFTRCDLKENYFAVIFPGEAHRPCVAPDGKGVKTRKAVAKILY